MNKTQEELNQLKNEYEALTNKLKELSNEELSVVTGGAKWAQTIGSATVLKEAGAKTVLTAAQTKIKELINE